MKKSIQLNALVIDDDPSISKLFKYNLEETKGYKVDIAETQEEAYNILDRKRFNFVLLDLKLPVRSPMDDSDIEVGFDTLKYIRDRFTKEKLPVMVMTAYGDEDTAVRAILRYGANDYIKKPFDVSREPLEDKLAGIIAFIMNQREGKRGRMRGAESKSIIGKNLNLIQAITLARRAAQRDPSVVILGETGTGKELLAREIHDNSSRKNAPFVAYDCTTKPDALIDSELFGIEKGVATNVDPRAGIIESADGGTLFLDEIADMPLNQQAKFLRVLQERRISRIGSRQAPKKIDFRILVATNRDLWKLIEEGKFREDLFYRINVISISLPPLRERKDDIPVLARHFLTKYGENTKRISREAMKKLKGHIWSGNVRELENVIQRALVLCNGKTISALDIKLDIRPGKTELDKLKRLPLNNRQKLIYSYIQENGKITSKEANVLTKASRRTSNNDLAEMLKLELIEKSGVGRGIFYALKAGSQQIASG